MEKVPATTPTPSTVTPTVTTSSTVTTVEEEGSGALKMNDTTKVKVEDAVGVIDGINNDANSGTSGGSSDSIAAIGDHVGNQATDNSNNDNIKVKVENADDIEMVCITLR